MKNPLLPVRALLVSVMILAPSAAGLAHGQPPAASAGTETRIEELERRVRELEARLLELDGSRANRPATAPKEAAPAEAPPPAASASGRDESAVSQTGPISG